MLPFPVLSFHAFDYIRDYKIIEENVSFAHPGVWVSFAGLIDFSWIKFDQDTQFWILRIFGFE
jgi:hypothetical protein